MNSDPIAQILQVFDDPPDGVTAWLVDGLRKWYRASGEVPLDRCLHLPATKSAFRRSLRDYWLRRAFYAAEGASMKQKFVALQAELAKFGLWKFPAWRKRGEAPAYASPIERALFQAFSFYKPPSTSKQLRTIIFEGSGLHKKLPEASGSMEPQPDEGDHHG